MDKTDKALEDLERQRTVQMIRAFLENLRFHYTIAPSEELENNIFRAQFALDTALGHLN